MNDFFENTRDYKAINFTYILVEQVNNRLFVTLNRAEKRNAFTPLMIKELAYTLQGANQDDTVKVVILQAKGPVFCAGMDLKIFKGEAKEEIPSKFQSIDITMSMALRQVNKPLIGVCEGPVIAGGFLLINECTMVLASENVWFRLPEIEIGLFPFQVMERLPLIVGERKAMQYALTGQKIEMEEAVRVGLVNSTFNLENKEEVLTQMVSSVEKASVELLTSAMKSLKMLGTLPEHERASALKNILDSFSKSN